MVSSIRSPEILSDFLYNVCSIWDDKNYMHVFVQWLHIILHSTCLIMKFWYSFLMFCSISITSSINNKLTSRLGLSPFSSSTWWIVFKKNTISRQEIQNLWSHVLLVEKLLNCLHQYGLSPLKHLDLTLGLCPRLKYRILMKCSTRQTSLTWGSLSKGSWRQSSWQCWW